MTIGHAVVLIFDSASENRLIGQWRSTRAGMDLEGTGARPHLSLALFGPKVDLVRLSACVAEFAAQATPISLSLTAVGAFPGEEGVVFLAPSPTSDLLTTHQCLHELLKLRSIPTEPSYQPERWVPHCTMALQVPHAEMPLAIETLRSAEVFGPIEIGHVVLLEYLPVKEVGSWQLTGARTASCET